MSQTEEQNSEQTLVASFEFVDSKPIDATFLISPNIRDLHYTHYQDTPAEKWMIHHNLGKYPSVSIISSAGELVYGDITYIDINNVQAEFIGAFAGKAYIN